MIYILFDPNQKNVVIGAFRGPADMPPAQAEQTIKAICKENCDGYVDSLESLGFESVAWTAVDVYVE